MKNVVNLSIRAEHIESASRDAWSNPVALALNGRLRRDAFADESEIQFTRYDASIASDVVFTADCPPVLKYYLRLFFAGLAVDPISVSLRFAPLLEKAPRS